MSTMATMSPAKKAAKQNTATLDRSAGGTQRTVSTGEPQKNTAVAIILAHDIGGDEGMYISKQMDAQALEIGKEKLTAGQIVRIGEGIKITYDGSAMFAKNTYILTEATKKDLRRIAATLTAYNNTKLIIEGHTDGTGSEKNNLHLSRARAQAVGIEEGPRPFHAVPGDGFLLTTAGKHQNAGLLHLSDDGWLQTAQALLPGQLLQPAFAGQTG